MSADFDEIGEGTLVDCPLTTWQELVPGGEGLFTGPIKVTPSGDAVGV